MQPWQSYEQVAQYLLNQMAVEFGLTVVEGKQEVAGTLSGATYEIDAKGAATGSDLFLIVECRRHTTKKIDQEEVAGLAYRIHDTGAAGGIIVSPLGLQEGAQRIAAAERIHSVTLSPGSTRLDYVLQFLNKIRVGVSDTLVLSDRAIAVVKNVKTGETRTIE